MSILSGFLKTKKYRKTNDGYKLQSEWTSASTVEMSDGKNLRFLYSYDQIKKVAYTSDSSMEKYDYMSICEIYYKGWEIIDREKAYNMLVPISFEMPF